MSYYILFIRREITDEQEMKTYSEKAALAAPGHRIEVLARYGRAQPLEGPALKGVVLLKFDTEEEALAWYESPAYQDAKRHRLAGSDYEVLMFAGT